MTPIRVNIRSYQVGFGDCFLFSLLYDSGDARHVLIDFGTTEMPKGISMGGRMKAIADDIAAYTSGQPIAVVATHRHKDHVSGFATNQKKTGSGDVIAALKPVAVVQPWTEDPDLEETATAPRRAASRRSAGALAPARVQALAAMERVSAAVLREARRSRSLKPETGEMLKFLGENNVKNLSAVRNLMTMAGSRARNHYVHAFGPSGLEEHLPGVKIDVLGPPTVEQHQEVSKQREWVQDEFWLRLASAADTLPRGDRNKVGPLFPSHVVERDNSKFPINTRWFVYRGKRLRSEQMLRIVTMLDDALNNTSVILLFRVGGKSFLFPGDAQWENWQFALQHSNVRDLLKDVNLYKVGHHGSRNATPMSLWNLFAHRSEDKAAGDRLISIMSTMPGKHGDEGNDTEVPRKPLVSKLRAQTDFHTTQTITADQLYFEVKVDI